MKKLAILVCFYNVFSSCGCSAEQSGDLSGSEKIEIVIPPSIEVYNSNLSKSVFYPANKNYSYKIFLVINASCATCLLKLQMWNNFLKEISKCKAVLLAAVCTSKDNFELLKFLLENPKNPTINYPLLLDYGGVFTKENKLFIDDMNDVAVLTNGQNSVVLAGSPIKSEEDKSNFLKKICSSQ